jgi:hypothetical protein
MPSGHLLFHAPSINAKPFESSSDSLDLVVFFWQLIKANPSFLLNQSMVIFTFYKFIVTEHKTIFSISYLNF